MSVTRDVPLDVLGQIFIACHDIFYSQSHPSPTYPEITLSHVCTQWRNLALSSHFKILWSIIIYDFWYLNDISRVKTYLQRSAPLPIQVTLKLLTQPGYDHRVFPQEIFDLVISQVGRWKEFTLVTSPGWTKEDDDTDVLKGPAALLWDAKAPLLESFSIINVLPAGEPSESHFPVESLDLQILVLPGNAPKLTSVHLTDIGVQYLLPPLNSVVELSLEGGGGAMLIGWDDLVGVILQLPTLRKLSIMGDILPGFQDDLPADLPLTIQAPYITHLRYDAGEDEQEETILLTILPRLSAPNLECLILGNIMEHGAVFGGAPAVATDEEDGSGGVFPKLRTAVLIQPSCEDICNPDADARWYTWLSRAAPRLETLKLVDTVPAGEESILAKDNLWPTLKGLVYAPLSIPLEEGAAAPTLETMLKVLVQFASARQSLETIRLPSKVLSAARVGDSCRILYRELEQKVKLKEFSALWDVAPEAFVFRTTGASDARPETPTSWTGCVGDLEVGGKSIL